MQTHATFKLKTKMYCWPLYEKWVGGGKVRRGKKQTDLLNVWAK